MPYCDRCGSESLRGAQYCIRCGATVESRHDHYRAEWGERVIAYVIDFIVLSLALGAIAFAAQIVPGSLPLLWTRHVFRWGPLGILHMKSLVFFGYWTFMEYVYGQSLGKMVMGIRVADIAGGQIALGQAVIESFGKAFILPLDLAAGLALSPWKVQRLSSLIAKTSVVRDSPECCPVEPIRV
ncbi:RDD family protein [Candidatus Bathyarchaeota archaeon]|nr:RDD family protein [Candidatus Bathyarchaeota archaeon]MBL7079767.1 RDD family protein [Candidatus Bathyarchaeota archaeon]